MIVFLVLGIAGQIYFLKGCTAGHAAGITLVSLT